MPSKVIVLNIFIYLRPVTNIDTEGDGVAEHKDLTLGSQTWLGSNSDSTSHLYVFMQVAQPFCTLVSSTDCRVWIKIAASYGHGEA